VEEMNLGWVARYRTEDGWASVQVVTHDATSTVDSVLLNGLGSAEAPYLGNEDRSMASTGARRKPQRYPDELRERAVRMVLRSGRRPVSVTAR
jgi:hypothetical protein